MFPTVMRWLQTNLLGAVLLSVLMTARAQGATGLQACDPQDGGYSSRAWQLMRDAQDTPMEPLIILGASAIQPGEIGIGLSQMGRRQHLIRLEFDPSLHKASTVEIAPNTYANNYADAKVRVLKATVPVSDSLATAFRSALNGLEAEQKVEHVILTEDGEVLTEIMLDSVTHQLMLAGARCVEAAPEQDTTGLKIVRLNYFLARGLRSWTPEGAAEFEAQALLLLREIHDINRANQ